MPPTATTQTLPPSAHEDYDFRKIPIGLLSPTPLNPRKTIHPEKQAELVASVREKGVLEPLLVREDPRADPSEGRFEIVAGERRYLAAKAALKQVLPCVVRVLTDAEVVEHALTENHQRADVHPLEAAEAIQHLLDLDRAYTVKGVALKLGVSESWVYKRLKLLRMSAAAQAAYLAGALTADHADQLAQVPPHQQDAALVACFSEVLYEAPVDGPETVVAALALARWDLLTDCLNSASSLKRWIASHTTADIADMAIQEAVPELQDAFAAAEVEQSKLIQVSLDPNLSEGEARTLGVVHRKRWIEIDEAWPTVTGGTISNRRCESQQQAVITHPPRPGEVRVVTICMKRSCQVHRPPVPEVMTFVARQAGPAGDEQAARDRAAADERARVWEQERLPVYLAALVAKIQKVKALTPQLVRVILDKYTLEDIEATFKVPLTPKTQLTVLLLSGLSTNHHGLDRHSVELERFGRIFGLTPAAWERAQKAAAKAAKPTKTKKPTPSKPSPKARKKGGR